MKDLLTQERKLNRMLTQAENNIGRIAAAKALADAAKDHPPTFAPTITSYTKMEGRWCRASMMCEEGEECGSIFDSHHACRNFCDARPDCAYFGHRHADNMCQFWGADSNCELGFDGYVANEQHDMYRKD